MLKAHNRYTTKIALFIFMPLLLNLFYIKQIGINIAYFILVMQCMSFIFSIKTIKVNSQRPQVLTFILLYLLFITAIFSGLFSSFKMRSFKLSFLVFIPSIFLFLLTISDNRPYKTFTKIFEVIMDIGMLFALIAIILFLFGENVKISDGRTVQSIKLGILCFSQIVMGKAPFYRVASLTSNPNSLGIILMLSQIATLYLYKIKKISKEIFFIFYIVQIIGLLLTQSRGAILTTCIMVILFYFLTREEKVNKAKMCFLLIIIVALVCYFIYKMNFAIFSRFQSGLSNRNLAWRVLINKIKERPFIGVGFGVSNEALLQNLGIKAHNVYLNCISEIGIIGFLIFAFIWLIGLVHSFMRAKKSNLCRKEKYTYALVFSILFSLVFHQMVESKLLVYDFMMFLWIYLISFSIIELNIGNN